MSKPITLYSHSTGPNPWKVAIILEELGVPYKTEFMDFGDLKKEPFEKINPNGRVPAIEDPNTGITLWESGAIIEYLIGEYDKDNKLSFSSSPEKYQAIQYLHFQMSGQGPYFGQLAWFTMFHAEKVPSAVERYRNEAKRVTGVLDHALAGKQYLVGDKVSYADLSFVPWFQLIGRVLGDDAWDNAKEFPNFNAWFERLSARPAVKKIGADQAKASGK